MRIAISIMILVVGVVVVGCGQKGPLYLPQDAAADSEQAAN
ncbi:MAG: putative small lipoprotein YifL [Oceanicoccus sp.]|jgi:predicted small lipoprotein YifL